MKIAILCFARKGGMVHYASQLANNLSKNNDVYVIITNGVDSKYFDTKINLNYVPLSSRIGINWLMFDSIIKAIWKIKPDVIHILTEHISLTPALIFLRKYPHVLTIHDVKKHPGDRGWVYQFYLLSLRLLIRQVDKIIVHGERLKSELVACKRISSNKIRVIPHGDYSFFTKYKKDNVEEKNTILFFGRIKEYKGLEYLIRVEPLITKEFSDIKIIIAGKGNFQEYKKIKNNANFEILNEFIPDEKVAELFQKSKVVVLPYIEASQSGIIPIAYAFKKAVVATNVGSIPEVVEDGGTGFLVPPKNVNALADAIIKLLKDDELRKQLGENAYTKMKQELSWGNIAEKTIEVYREAIKEHKNKRTSK